MNTQPASDNADLEKRMTIIGDRLAKGISGVLEAIPEILADRPIWLEQSESTTFLLPESSNSPITRIQWPFFTFPLVPILCVD